LEIFNDFTSPTYVHALVTSIKYGFFVVIGMLLAGTVLTLLGGGTAAMGWKKEPAHEHHH